MSRRQNASSPRRIIYLGAVGALALAGTLYLFGSGVVTSSRTTSKSIGGLDRLTAIEPLPSQNGAQCEWEPASYNMLALAKEVSRADIGNTPKTSTELRKPIRKISDPYAAYSSVAIDPVNNEVVLTDENLFNIMVYDRMTNTPPSAKMSEPKRMIGGVNTKIEFQCGLYIDPVNGDIFAVNNDTVDSLVIFSREAKGNVPPNREIHTPHGTFGIAVDEEAQELYLTVQHDAALVVYNKNAKREDSPLRLLQGSNTKLADPHGVAVDVKHKLMFIANHGAVHDVDPNLRSSGGVRRGEKQNWPLERAFAVPGSGRNEQPSITVYDKNATGNTPPLRVITGPNTQLNWPSGLSVDPDRGELYVANDMGNAILIFDITAEGDVAPKRSITGPETMIKNPTGVFVDAKNDEVWSSNFGNHTATVYKRSASGNVPPLRLIRSGPIKEPSLGIGNPHPVAYDSKREQILVPN